MLCNVSGGEKIVSYVRPLRPLNIIVTTTGWRSFAWLFITSIYLPAVYPLPLAYMLYKDITMRVDVQVSAQKNRITGI